MIATGNPIIDMILLVSAIVAALAGIVSGIIYLVVKPIQKWYSKNYSGKIIRKKEKEMIDLKKKFQKDIEKMRTDFEIRCERHDKAMENSMHEILIEISKAMEEGFNKMDSRLDHLESAQKESDKKREESQPKFELLIEGVLASLKAHKEKGANGTVTPALDKMQAYVVKQASK